MTFKEKLIKAFYEKIKMQEANTTANFDVYNTPKAFQGKSKRKKQNILKQSQSKVVKESSYRDFVKKDEENPRVKLNKSLIQINKGLDELIQMLDNNIKLQKEFSLKGSLYKKSPQKINKIAKKLTYISNKIKELG